MTREEAIICLKGIKNYGRDTFNEQSDWQGCLDMAIKALEQQPCEDTISRQAALMEALCHIDEYNEKVCNGCHYNDGGVHAECIVCDKKENRKEFGYEDDSTIPAHWIDQGHKIFKCSNCGNYLDFRGVNAGRGTANYCPNCGAKMWNILTRKPQKLTKREEEIRDYIVNEYGEALLERYLIFLDTEEENMSDE